MTDLVDLIKAAPAWMLEHTDVIGGSTVAAFAFAGVYLIRRARRRAEHRRNQTRFGRW